MDAFFALLYRRTGDLVHGGYPCRVACARIRPVAGSDRKRPVQRRGGSAGRWTDEPVGGGRRPSVK